MNFDDLRKTFLKGGEKALKTLANQMKQVMNGEMYEKLMKIVTTRQNKANTIQKECSNWLGGVV